ncbi:histidine kinase dimerization/phospho-acceptor domain-containing protein [Roseobacter weihaiensis]|uniref:histidine kinase dimerization/phospho-acceptor domain-containing protein n=1 Tax=Roseobacter weihaiensis TaxID=2763262 RepID=UPI0029CAB9E8|nr:histidine kinase dimerization/phospho-acceptor domain-containing protein [Roseobacter sp. H9]
MLVPTGPNEVQDLTSAFNRMQDRLTRFVAARTQLLAALGHDLRSPLTALRVQVEMVEDAETRDRLIVSIEEMQSMVRQYPGFPEQGLDKVFEPFLRLEGPEKPAALGLTSPLPRRSFRLMAGILY